MTCVERESTPDDASALEQGLGPPALDLPRRLLVDGSADIFAEHTNGLVDRDLPQERVAAGKVAVCDMLGE
jgi:hypothetical protein